MAWPWPKRLLFGEHPVHYNTATIGRFFRTTTDAAVSASGGDGGVPAITFDTGSGTTSGTQTIASSPPAVLGYPEDRGETWPDTFHFYMGSRLYMDALPGSDTPIYFIVNEEGFVQLSLNVGSSGELVVYSSFPGSGSDTELWSSGDLSTPFTLSATTHHKIVFAGSINRYPNGWFSVWVDGEQIIYLSQLDTYEHDLLPPKGFGWCGLDDWMHTYPYGGGGVPMDNDKVWSGGHAAVWLEITDAGTYEEFTPNAGTTDTAIDDATPDDATTMIEADAVGQRFSVLVDELPVTRTINGVQVALVYKRPENSSVTLRPATFINGAHYLGEIGGAADDWSAVVKLWRNNPSTGGGWSRTRINAAEWGGKV